MIEILRAIRCWFYRIEDWPILWKRWLQRRIRGFSDNEIWNLGTCLAEWLLPRLKCFKKSGYGQPYEMTREKWHNTLDEMIEGLELEVTMDDWWWFDDTVTPKEKVRNIKKIKKAYMLIGKYWNQFYD